MSEFFRALERAERERALRSKARSAPAAESPSPDAPPPAGDPTLAGATVLSPTTAGPTASAGGPANGHDVIDTTAAGIAAVIDTVDVPPVDAMPIASAPSVELPSPPRIETEAPSARATTTSDPRPVERSWARPLSQLLASRAGRTSNEVDEHLVSLITPGTFEADQYRVLRHTVEQRRRTAGLAVVAVSSAGAGDGKTTTAINLAGALAQDRAARVLLVDCDLRGSALARRLGLGEGRGLVQAIVDPMLTLEDAIRHLPRFNLDVMAAGFETASPYELLKSPRLGELLDAARRRYDYIVLDTPPVVPFPDCRVLGKVVDGFLLVVQAHRTPRRLVDEALGVLPKDMVVGIVFNGHDQAVSPYHGYYDRDAAAPSSGWGASARRALSHAWRDAGATGTTGR